jgi:hypothetical protein
MKNDKTMKLLMALIATGLWMNVLGPFFLSKAQANADDYLSNIEHDIHSIYSGTCLNRKLCGY